MQLFSGIFKVRTICPHYIPELLTVIQFETVRQFMYDNVIDEGNIEMNKSPVQSDMTFCGTGSPAGPGVGNTKRIKWDSHPFCMKLKLF